MDIFKKKNRSIDRSKLKPQRGDIVQFRNSQRLLSFSINPDDFYYVINNPDSNIGKLELKYFYADITYRLVGSFEIEVYPSIVIESWKGEYLVVVGVSVDHLKVSSSWPISRELPAEKPSTSQ